MKTKQRTEELQKEKQDLENEIQEVMAALQSLGCGSLDIPTDGKKENLLLFLAKIEEKLVELLVTSNQLPSVASKTETSISQSMSAVEMLDDKMGDSSSNDNDEDDDFSALDASDFRKKFEQMNNLS